MVCLIAFYLIAGENFFVFDANIFCNKIMRFVLALWLIFLFPTLIFAQSDKTREIRQINSYVRKLSVFVEKNPKSLEIYANVSQTEKPKWKKFKSETAFEKFRKNKEVDEVAYVWRKSGKVVAANFTFSSASGDWAHYIFHRFRENGSLAKVEADLRTFYGRISVARNFYFDNNGKLLRKTAQYRDISTDKSKKPGEDFIDEEVYIFKKVSKLPFAELLKS